VEPDVAEVSRFQRLFLLQPVNSLKPLSAGVPEIPQRLVFRPQMRRQVLRGLLDVADAEFKRNSVSDASERATCFRQSTALAISGLLVFQTDLAIDVVDQLGVDVTKEIEQVSYR